MIRIAVCDEVVIRGGFSLPVGGNHMKEVRDAIGSFWRKRL